MTHLRPAALLLLTIACAPTDSFDPLPPASVPDDLAATLASGRSATVIVQLDDRALIRDVQSARTSGDRKSILDVRAARVQELSDALLRDLPAGARSRHVYKYMPLVAVEVDDLAAANALASRVVRMEAERAYEMTLTQSLSQIGQPTVEALGYTGAGTSVAVLDTGANYTHADLGSCTAVDTGVGCRVVYAEDFATEDNSRDDNGHGTNVSAIVAAVASEADIIALDVFQSSGYAYTVDILSALDWVVANQATYNIAAVNMSLGSGSYTAECYDSFSTGIDAVRDAGVAVAVASGNNGYTNKVSSPACNAAAVSVGAVYDANMGGVGWSSCTDTSTAVDKVTCFSNSYSFLDILAPGALITAGGYTMGGTSQATPHVAGGLAVLRAAFPDMTVDELETQLIATGVDITDTRNGLTFPRMDLVTATDGAVSVDVTDPEGDVWIEADAVATALKDVTLMLDASDDSGEVSEMCVSSTTTCTAWQTYATELAWTLSTGNGTKTVYAKFRDATGNESAQVSDTIYYDTGKPTNGTVTLTPGDGELGVTWTGYSDPYGIESYTVVYGTTSPASCSVGTVAYEGADDTATIDGLTNGTTYYVRVCAVDYAGNLSTGSTANTRVAPEFVGPVGTISINSGAAWTNNKVLSLALSATDTSGVSQMCFSTSATSCTTWVTYATTSTYTLTSTTVGSKTVYATFKDVHGNVGAAASDTISYDAVVPKNGTLSAVTVDDGEVSIPFTGFTDVNAGIASYKVVYAATTAPTTCALGTVGWTGATSPATVTGLTNGTLYGFRVCAVDAAGNVSTGVTTTATPKSELVAPTGTIVAAAGAAFTGSRTIDVAITGTDPSGVASMCLNASTAACTTFVPFATSGQVVVTTDGAKTVNVVLKDTNGNVSAPISDTITVDTVKPVNGTVTGTAGTQSIALTWSGFTDASSGIASYKVVYGTTSPATSCTTGTVAYTGTGTSTTVSGLTTGTKYTVRVCAVDTAGNVSTGITSAKTPL